MKVVKYPKWKKKCQCKVCGTKFIISAKDVAKGKIPITNYPSNCHATRVYCPFCSEYLKIDIQEFFERSDDE